MAAVIRDAIDRLEPDQKGRGGAIRAILQAPPMPVPARPVAIREELDPDHDRFG
jgi:hypothetical protein